MKKILENCQKEKELLDKNFLKEFQRESFSKFNLIIGKNGSGKTRMLHFLEDVANKHENCNVIFLDCTENSMNETEIQEDISVKLIFNETLSAASLANLFINIKSQLPQFISYLEGLCSTIQIKASQLLEKMNTYLKTMLGRTLYINNNSIYIGHPSLEDRRLAQEIEVFSPGERNIVIFALSLLCIQLNVNKPSLLLIDEIETHLHPAVLQEMFKMLRESLKDVDCCVFIATHSIFLLPEFKFGEICYFEQGELKKVNGNVYRDILDTLVYGGEDTHSISELLISVDTWSYAAFMAECFSPPTVSDQARADDPQYLKMDFMIQKLLATRGGEKLEVLDFGAGDARIGMCMKMDYESRTPKELPQINYHVYDKHEITDEFKSGEFVFGNKYESRYDLADSMGTMDIVLLYNVLHEVGVDEWHDELNLALSLLKDDGVLIFSERKTLSVGEKPYGKSGYLLLGKEEIEILFSEMRVVEIELKQDKRRNTWGFAIQNPNGKMITIDKVEKTIERLMKHTQETIKEYYHLERVAPFKARDYAFYCQQYFNAKEALVILEEKLIPQMKFQFIQNGDYTPKEKRDFLKKRAEIDDVEGRKCKRYLEDNPD